MFQPVLMLTFCLFVVVFLSYFFSSHHKSPKQWNSNWDRLEEFIRLWTNSYSLFLMYVDPVIMQPLCMLSPITGFAHSWGRPSVCSVRPANSRTTKSIENPDWSEVLFSGQKHVVIIFSLRRQRQRPGLGLQTVGCIFCRQCADILAGLIYFSCLQRIYVAYFPHLHLLLLQKKSA